MTRIPLSKPDHPNEPGALSASLREVILSRRFEEGDLAAAFERRMAEFCGSVFAVATNSGTSALDAICAVTGLTSDVHVICPSYAPTATINALLAAGATPIFADIDPKTYHVSLEEVERRITPKTRAVLLVHQYGIPANGKAFAKFCRERDLVLIEDAGCGLGSRYDGRAIGSFGLAGLVSFHPRKVLSGGEGGMVLTDDESLAARARSFGSIGTPPGNAWSTDVAAGSRMSEFQAALGHWALDRAEEAISRRTKLAHRYDDTFDSVSGITTFFEPGRGEWNRETYPVRVDGSRRDLVADALRKDGIETSHGLQPAHLHPYIDARMRPPRLPETEAAYAETLLLPMYATLTFEEQDRVIESLVKALR
ncbi:MAG: DegT/DnrJ/EryC1/StrS family aminotransferase [Pseudomonadota bacterium]